MEFMKITSTCIVGSNIHQHLSCENVSLWYFSSKIHFEFKGPFTIIKYLFLFAPHQFPWGLIS